MSVLLTLNNIPNTFMEVTLENLVSACCGQGKDVGFRCGLNNESIIA